MNILLKSLFFISFLFGCNNSVFAKPVLEEYLTWETGKYVGTAIVTTVATKTKVVGNAGDSGYVFGESGESGVVAGDGGRGLFGGSGGTGVFPGRGGHGLIRNGADGNSTCTIS